MIGDMLIGSAVWEGEGSDHGGNFSFLGGIPSAVLHHWALKLLSPTCKNWRCSH